MFAKVVTFHLCLYFMCLCQIKKSYNNVSLCEIMHSDYSIAKKKSLSQLHYVLSQYQTFFYVLICFSLFSLRETPAKSSDGRKFERGRSLKEEGRKLIGEDQTFGHQLLLKIYGGGRVWLSQNNLDDDVFVTIYSPNDRLRDLRFGRGVSLMNLCKCSDRTKQK